MVEPSSILVMAGTREAQAIISGLKTRGRRVVASLPEPTRGPEALTVETHNGGFAEADDLIAWLDCKNTSTVIDASHAFESGLSILAHSVCQSRNLRYLRVLRRPWVPSARDRWSGFATVGDAAEAVPEQAHAFSNTGWLSIPEYAGFTGKRLFMRQTHEVHGLPKYDFLEFVEGHPPFSQNAEEKLFKRLGITHLICRNVGGAASMSKLLAARRLMLPVYMVDRRPPPDGADLVETAAEALAWEASG